MMNITYLSARFLLDVGKHVAKVVILFLQRNVGGIKSGRLQGYYAVGSGGSFSMVGDSAPPALIKGKRWYKRQIIGLFARVAVDAEGECTSSIF